MKLIHTADNHLDMALSSLPFEKAAIRKKERLLSFSKIIDYTISHNADTLLISGDLFDSPSPSDAVLNFCVNEFERLGDIPVFISLGNHDYGISGDVFPGNVHVFPKNFTSFSTETFTVSGISFASPYASFSKILTSPCDKSEINILCLHGDLFSKSEYNPLNKEKLLSLGYDYIALGHIHQSQILSPIAYPGCHDGSGFDEEGEKGFLECDIDKFSAKIRFIPSSSRVYETLFFDISEYSSSQSLADELAKSINNGIYKVILTGKPENNFSPNLDYIQKKLSGNAFYVKLTQDLTQDNDISKSSLFKLFSEYIGGNCSEEIADLAIEYGTKALKGEDII